MIILRVNCGHCFTKPRCLKCYLILNMEHGWSFKTVPGNYVQTGINKSYTITIKEQVFLNGTLINLHSKEIKYLKKNQPAGQ